MHNRSIPDSSATEEIAQIVRAIPEGRITRREFTQRALALGLSSSLAATIFTTYRARTGLASGHSTGAPIASRSFQAAQATPTAGGTLRFARAEDSTNFDQVALPLN